ncbi:threonine deaminase [Massospora cicadina]|nr:threonine deaminase [Massospora cicadina]
MAASKLGVRATIVMPLNTPEIKWKNVERLGATVILKGNDFDEAKVEGRRLVLEKGMTDIPPFDDPYVIAGQGTVGVEILRQAGDLDDVEAIFCCAGGGGLVAGIASYVKRLRPSIKIFAVETLDSYALTHSLREGAQSRLPQVGLLLMGRPYAWLGPRPFGSRRAYTRSVVEPAGALSVAGLKRWLSLTRKAQVEQFALEKGQVQAEFPGSSNGPFVFFPDVNVLLSSRFIQGGVPL